MSRCTVFQSVQRRARIIKAMGGFYNRHGYPATQREIADIVGCVQSTVQYHIPRLIDDGAVAAIGAAGSYRRYIAVGWLS